MEENFLKIQKLINFISCNLSQVIGDKEFVLENNIFMRFNKNNCYKSNYTDISFPDCSNLQELENLNDRIHNFSKHLCLTNIRCFSTFTKSELNQNIILNSIFKEIDCINNKDSVLNIFILDKNVKNQILMIEEIKIFVTNRNSIVSKTDNFMINLFVVKLNDQSNASYNENLKKLKIIFFELDHETEKIFKSLNIINNKINNNYIHLCVLNKLGNIIINEEYTYEKLFNYINFKQNFNHTIHHKHKRLEYELNENQFLNLISSICALYKEIKKEKLYFYINVDIKFHLKYIYNNCQNKFYLSLIEENSLFFLFSAFHKEFYKLLYQLNLNSDILPMKRFKSKDRNLIPECLSKYRELMDQHGIVNKDLIVKKKWNYNVGNIENNFKIYNKTGRTTIDDFEDLSNFTTKLRKEYSKLSKTLHVHYKIFKKKHKKNFIVQYSTPSGPKYFENTLGQSYFIYISINHTEDIIISCLGNLAQISNQMKNSHPNLNIEAFIYNSEDIDCNNFAMFNHKINYHLINEVQVLEFMHYINPYDNEYFYLFLFIDEQGFLYPIYTDDIIMVGEKLKKMLHKKTEISKEQYYQVKKLNDKFFSENYILNNKNENFYRFTFNFHLEKNKILDESDILKENKYYILANMKMRDIDYKNQILIHHFLKEIEIFIPNFSKSILQKEIYETIDLSEKTISCKICSQTNFTEFIYYCYFCDLFFCKDCKEEDEDDFHHDHNLLIIVNLERSKENLKYLEKYKFGTNARNFFSQTPQHDVGFACSYCGKTKEDGCRYICLNCRGCDLVLTSNDSNSNGYIESCQDCFDELSEYYSNKYKIMNESTYSKTLYGEDEDLSLEYMIDKVEQRDNHIFDSHVYIKIDERTGSYNIY